MKPEKDCKEKLAVKAMMAHEEKKKKTDRTNDKAV